MPPLELVPSTAFTRPPGAGLWFLFRRRELVLSADALTLLREPAGLPLLRSQYLGELDGTPCWSGEVQADAELPGGLVTFDLRRLFGRVDERLVWLAGRAVQISEWDRTHQFCGACGATTEPHLRMRARVCTACGLEHYPRVAPAMIVAVERGPEILLARAHHFPPGIYSTLAGFVDAGESLEECVHREVLEETSVRVTNLRYFASQQWPFPHSLMLGFHADYAGGQIACEEHEIADAAFFHVDALPPLFPGRISMASHLIADFCARHGRPYPGG
jgi:NAD+ diphosphatase